MTAMILYGIAFLLLGISWKKNHQKTKKALKKGYHALLSILPAMLLVLLLIGLILTLLSADTISKLIGGGSGIWGVLLAAGIGSITMIPGFVAFPLAAALLEHGAGIVQIAAFVSTLMMVGIVTLPMEIETIGKVPAILRNILSFCWALLVAFLMGVAL